MSRAGLVARVLAGIALGLLAGVVAFGAPGHGGDGARAAPPSGFAGGLLPPDTPVPRVALHDERGRLVRLGGPRRAPAVVAFLSAVCRDTCPLTVQTIRGALDDLGRDVPVYAIAVDPAADTPAAAKRFLLRQSVTGRMRFLLGTRAQLRPAWRGFAVQPQTQTIAHQARIVLVDRRGMQRVGWFAPDATPELLAHDLRLLLAGR